MITQPNAITAGKSGCTCSALISTQILKLTKHVLLWAMIFRLEIHLVIYLLLLTFILEPFPFWVSPLLLLLLLLLLRRL
jgi:hypothetical protein